jgi:nitrite reductase/ring-hydroxylating ferredoxin subunit
MFREIAGADEILSGGMKAYQVDGKEIVLCNDGGRFYALDRRCVHMNSTPEMGTANGFVITCPLHSVQFDATTGKALNPPVPRNILPGTCPKRRTALLSGSNR